MRRGAALFLLLLLLLGGGGGLLARSWASQGHPARSGTLRVAALQSPVELYWDENGVPHLFAATPTDLQAALGVVHAQDRLWQMELRRHAAQGRLAELLGPTAAPADRLFRALDSAGAGRRAYAALDAESRAVVDAYAAGVNSYVAGAAAMPLEYRILGLAWQPWEPADTMALAQIIAWEWSGGWEEALLQARVTGSLVADLLPNLPGLDPAADAGPWTAAADLAPLYEALARAGIAPSNRWSRQALSGWVVAGGRTADGQPMLVLDLAAPPAIPGRWMAAALHAPGWQAAGASLPGLPGIWAGHNGRVAWGAAPTFQSQRLVRAPAAGLPLGALTGEESDWVVSGSATDPAATFLPTLLALGRAESGAAVEAAVTLWDGPPLSWLYADDGGVIAHLPAGGAPERNPAADLLLLGEETAPRRAARLHALLDGALGLTPAGAERVQSDVAAPDGASLAERLVAVQSGDIIVQRAQEQLSTWNRQLDGALPGAGIYEVSRDGLARAILADDLGPVLEDYLALVGAASITEHFLARPNDPLWDDRTTAEVERPEQILDGVLVRMTDDLGRRYGDVPHEWFWERIHPLHLEHALSPRPVGALRPLAPLLSRRLPGTGNGDTVLALPVGPDFSVASLPAYRQIIPVGAWESSRLVVIPGQSGHPLDPHYTGGLRTWPAGPFPTVDWVDSPSAASDGARMRLQP